MVKPYLDCRFRLASKPIRIALMRLSDSVNVLMFLGLNVADAWLTKELIATGGG